MPSDRKKHADLERFALQFGNQLGVWTAQAVSEGFAGYNPMQLKMVTVVAILARAKEIEEIRPDEVLDYYFHLAVAMYEQHVGGGNEGAKPAEPKPARTRARPRFGGGHADLPPDFHMSSREHAELAGYSHPDEADPFASDE